MKFHCPKCGSKLVKLSGPLDLSDISEWLKREEMPPSAMRLAACYMCEEVHLRYEPGGFRVIGPLNEEMTAILKAIKLKAGETNALFPSLEEGK